MSCPTARFEYRMRRRHGKRVRKHGPQFYPDHSRATPHGSSHTHGAYKGFRRGGPSKIFERYAFGKREFLPTISAPIHIELKPDVPFKKTLRSTHVVSAGASFMYPPFGKVANPPPGLG